VSQLVAAGEGRPAVNQDRTGDDLAVLLYTSGTSGRPKGAMLPVRALLANLEQLAALQPAPLTAEDRIFLPLPMFHIFGLNVGVGMALYFGATAVLSSKFDGAASVQTIADERVTVVVGAPVEFAVWAAQPNFRQAFAGVRYALSGSAPLLPELVATYADAGVQLFEGYGLTEAAPVVTSNLGPSGSGTGWADPKAGSIGRPLPGVEVRLIDDDGEVVEPGDLGLLEVRGANLFAGYWPDGSGGPDEEGWFATGDLAVADDDGDYYLVGRRHDLVLVNGFNVYPAEVEAVLSKLPGVHEVAVLGEPDGDNSEAVVAYIVPEPGAVLDPDDILASAARSLARFKLPKRIVEVEALPHTATGKVMKWRLRAASGEVTS
jgi:long-chain acyl-CoA synthetase